MPIMFKTIYATTNRFSPKELVQLYHMPIPGSMMPIPGYKQELESLDWLFNDANPWL